MTDEDYRALMRADHVPVGGRGTWLIDRFDIGRPRSDRHGRVVPAGRYTSLRQISLEPAGDGTGENGDGVAWTTWMSDVPGEIEAALPFVRIARGDVLVTGLGLGTILRALAAKPEVHLVTVVERDPHVRELVWPTYAADPKLQLVPGDALTVDLGETFDCAWHDIWPSIHAGENIPQMFELERRFDVRGPIRHWSLPECIFQMVEAEIAGMLPPGAVDDIQSMLRACHS